MKPLDQISIEKVLQKLPRFTRSTQADAKFLAQLTELAQKMPYEAPKRALTAWRAFFSLRRMAYASSFALVFLLTVGTFAAYQPSVTRGKALYPWKQAAERIELAAAFSPLQEVNVHLRFADRRMSEAENIIAQNPSLAWMMPAARAHERVITLSTDAELYLVKTLQERGLEIEKASEIVEVKIVAAEAVEKALEKIEAVSTQHVARLENFEKRGQAKVKEIVLKAAEKEKENRDTILEAVKAVKEARKNSVKEFKVEIRKLREEMKNSKEKGARNEEKKELKILKNRAREIKKEAKEEIKEINKEGTTEKKAKNKKETSADEIPLIDVEKLMKEIERDIIETHETVPLPGGGNSEDGRKKDRPDGRWDDLDIRGTEKIRSPGGIPASYDKKGAF